MTGFIIGAMLFSGSGIKTISGSNSGKFIEAYRNNRCRIKDRVLLNTGYISSFRPITIRGKSILLINTTNGEYCLCNIAYNDFIKNAKKQQEKLKRKKNE